MRDIGKNIKDLWIRKKLTQDELAEKLFVTRQTVSNYETGKTNPDSYAIIKLASFFDVSCDYLLGVIDVNINKKETILKELADISKKIDYIQRYLKN